MLSMLELIENIISKTVYQGFLHENLTSPVLVKLQSVKCQYCERVGHMEDQCFDLHPCQHVIMHQGECKKMMDL